MTDKKSTHEEMLEDIARQQCARQEIRLLDSGQGYIKLIDYMGDELAIVNAARVSYDRSSDSFNEKDKKLLKYLIDHLHISPFEMCKLKFEVYCPMFVRNQWMRHRTWSYNEVSRRYTSENIDFYIPEDFRKQDKKNKQVGILALEHSEVANKLVADATNECFKTYEDLIKMGVCREQARMILPQNLMTKFIACTDLNNLIKFLKLRDHEDSQYEIRVYAKAIKSIIALLYPNVSDFCFGKK